MACTFQACRQGRRLDLCPPACPHHRASEQFWGSDPPVITPEDAGMLTKRAVWIGGVLSVIAWSALWWWLSGTNY